MRKKLENFIAADFLSNYWQKKPMVIRQAIPDFSSLISADELAGLAFEAEVESRLIIENGKTPWELRHGPFDESTFTALPESHWTMLVQSVDYWIPEINGLLDYFHFLPRWRLEDIMISYAVDGGNVGPHYDHFDVFLIQAEGKRCWQVGPAYDETAASISGIPLHILSEFSSDAEYVMKPGDVLYLPPGVGHHGVAKGECMTISIGFRAPSHREILMGFTDYISDQLNESLRYSDPDQKVPENMGRIDEEALQRVQGILKKYIDDKLLLAQWFGTFMTEPKHAQESVQDIGEWSSILVECNSLSLQINEGSRLAFYEDGKKYLFADGDQFEFPGDIPEWAETLCHEGRLHFSEWAGISEENEQGWLLQKLKNGILYFD